MACIHLHGLYTAIGSTVLKTGEFILPAGKDTCLLHQPFSELQKEEYFRPWFQLPGLEEMLFFWGLQSAPEGC